MQSTLSLHEIISWLITAVSITLFIYERKKNNLTPFYMNLQGLLKTCHIKAVFYWGAPFSHAHTLLRGHDAPKKLPNRASGNRYSRLY